MKMLLIAVFSLLCGCGAAEEKFGGGKDGATEGDNTPEGDESETNEERDSASRSMLVVDEAAMPTCDEAGEGWLVYVASTKTLKACQTGSWVDVELSKPEPTKIVASILCGGELDDTGIFVTYSVAQMSSGDVFATAEISAGVKQASSARFYSAQQTGALVAAVLVTDDQLGDANGGFWTVSLNRETLVTTVAYEDADADDLMTWTQKAKTCVANTY